MERTIGIRVRSWSPSLRILRPKKFAARAPVAITIASVRMMPRPGTWKPKSASLRSRSGKSSSDWSMRSTRSFRTHSVIPSGIQTSRPATK
jgi:hypothetical protein